MTQLSSRLALCLFLTLISSLINYRAACAERAFSIAQVIPDNSLGSENSRTRPDTIKNMPSDVIEGGATRGSNLFHSFREFSIKEGRGAYFANPNVIQNIFTRVTGENISNILGTLGVLGNANLFLINPSGIIFGPDARLDIRGAFIGSTADSLLFDNNFEFSATNPDAPPLLTVNIPIGLRFREKAADISSTGNLATPGNLTLKAGNLNLSGSLASGGDLTLEALETLIIRDSVISPFMAASSGNLLLQGNQNVDIYTLNHPQSGLISGGDLTLRSANAVSGDAHFWSGGSFRIEKLDGSLGGLVSLYDPVIRASGDVSLDSYTGTSLHILAGGLVFIPGTILITGVDDTGDSLAETVTSSDGSTINLNGSLEPTLDIRAGTTAVGRPFFETGTPTSADIFIGGISFIPIGGNGGKVFLSNQYQPNTALETLFGGVTVGAIDTRDVNGGSVIIDARSGINLTGQVNVSALNVSSSDVPSYLGNGGDVKLLSQGNLNTNSSILAQGLLGGNVNLLSTADLLLDNGLEINVRGGGGGNITINAQNVGLLNASKLRAGIATGLGTPEAQAGDIKINATGIVAIVDGSLISNALLPASIGNAGDIDITTSSLFLTDGGQVQARTFGKGNVGIVKITASEIIFLSGVDANGLGSSIRSRVESEAEAEGNSGGIEIATGSLFLKDGAQIQVSTYGRGDAGDIIINTKLLEGNGQFIIGSETSGQGNAGQVIVNATERISLTGGMRIGIVSKVNQDATGNGGGIVINTPVLSLSNFAQLATTTLGQGNAGNITIHATESISLSQSSVLNAISVSQGNAGKITIDAQSASVFLDGAGTGIITSIGANQGLIGTGQGGNIIITAKSLNLTNSTQIIASTFGKASVSGLANAGNIFIKVVDAVSLRGRSLLSSQTSGEGNAGKIEIITGSLNITDGAGIDVSTFGTGNAGDIKITARDTIFVAGKSPQGLISSISSIVGIHPTEGNAAEGNAGGIEINTGYLYLADGVQVGTQTFGKGNAGNISITAKSLSLTNGAQLNALTSGLGNAGNVSVNIDETIALDGNFSGILTRVDSEAIGRGGDINLTAGSLSLSNGAQIASDTFGIGDAGNIKVDVLGQITLKGFVASPTDFGILPVQSSIATGVQGGMGNAGTITIKAQSLSLDNFSLITTATNGIGNAADISIKVDDFLTLTNLSTIESIVGAGAIGNSGNIDLKAQSLTLTNGSQIETQLSREFQFLELNLPGGQGKAGNININTTDFVSISGVSQVQLPIDFPTEGLSSGLFASSEKGALGDGGMITLTTNALHLANGAVINTLSANSGKAGDITINANTFETTGGGQVIAITRSSGKAGTITLNITDNLILLGSDPTFSARFAQFGEDIVNNQGAESGLFAQTSGQGFAGNIIINTPIFNIADSAIVSARTSSSGKGGSITINSPIFFTLGEKSQLNVETSGAGKAGNINITSDIITIGTNAQISATATKDASNIEGGSSININASNLNIAGELGIFAETQGQAPAGTLTLNPDHSKPNLNIRFIEQGKISASTSASGQGGDINISAPNSIDIRGNGTIATETLGSGNAGTINLNTNQLTLSEGVTVTASTTGTGDAGQISITANTLTSNNGGNIQTNTSSSGNAGDIILNISDNLSLNNSTIAASTTPNSTGTGGNITINPNTINLDQQARISVNSQGLGDGGNIFLTSENLFLNNRSEISATTASGEGGNIILNVFETISQRNNSPISATAGGTGNGGNITMKTQFLIGNENSNITANAFEGAGGNINITADGIFRNPNSEITASSQLGVDGVVETNTPEVDPSRGLIEFPQNLVDPNALISQNACRRGGQSEFIVRGRGGLPSTPEQVQSSNEVEVGLVEATEQEATTKPVTVTTATRKIVPAQGWRRNDKGEMVLVAYPTADGANRQVISPANCLSN